MSGGDETPATAWHLYVVRTADDRLYTGVATDVDRRFDEHSGSPRGAKFLRGRGPMEIVYRVEIGDRSLAQSAENRVKRLSRQAKERIVREAPGVAELLPYLGLESP